MKNRHFFVIFACIGALVIMSGCATTSFGNLQAGNFGNSSAGNFGSTADQQKAIDWFVTTYGDPRGSGAPALIEPIVSTNVVNDMPADKVTTFSKDTDKIFFWVFYEHFSPGDPIDMNLVYSTNGQTVLSSQQKTAGEYGPVTGSVSKPANGWPVGKYTITFSGRGASSTVNFEIVDGQTVTIPLPYASTQLPGTSNATTKQIFSTVNHYGINEEGIKSAMALKINAVNIYVLKDGSGGVTFNYLPTSAGQGSDEKTIRNLATLVFDQQIIWPITVVKTQTGPYSQSVSNIDDNSINIPVNNSPKVTNIKRTTTVTQDYTVGISHLAKVMQNETGYVYSTSPLIFPSTIGVIELRYFDTASARAYNVSSFPQTTHFFQPIQGGYEVWPIQPNLTSDKGEPVPGAEVTLEQEPDDVPFFYTEGNDLGINANSTLSTTASSTVTQGTNLCQPISNSSVSIYLRSTTGTQVLIATSTTDTNGDFNFTVPLSRTNTADTSYTFNFMITPPGSLQPDGSNVDIVEANVSEGPYQYNACNLGGDIQNMSEGRLKIMVSDHAVPREKTTKKGTK